MYARPPGQGEADQHDCRECRRAGITMRVASTVQTAKGVEYIAASAPDTHHEAIIDLGKNREPGWLHKARRA